MRGRAGDAHLGLGAFAPWVPVGGGEWECGVRNWRALCGRVGLTFCSAPWSWPQ